MSEEISSQSESDEYDSDIEFEINKDLTDVEDFVEEIDTDFECNSKQVYECNSSLSSSRNQLCNITKASELIDSKNHPNSERIIEIFNLFIGHDIVREICEETNQHLGRLPGNTIEPFTTEEICAFIGILLASGVTNLSFNDLWTSLRPFSMPFFIAAMSRNRFINIFSYIRFDNRETRIEASFDKLKPIRSIFNKFVDACKNNCPSTNITEDERIVAYRGKCPFRVFKKSRIGIKVQVATDSKNGYICNMKIYTGMNNNKLNEGNQVVKELIKPRKTNRYITSKYSCVRSTKRWTFRLFMEMVDIAAFNAYLLWIEKYPEWRKNDTYKRKSFIKELSVQLAKPNIIIRRNLQTENQDVIENVLSYIEKTHPIVDNNITINNNNLLKDLKDANKAIKRVPARSCRLCPNKTKKRSTLVCNFCKKPVCTFHRMENKYISCYGCDKRTYL